MSYRDVNKAVDEFFQTSLDSLNWLCSSRSLVAQTVKNLPTVWATQVQSLGLGDPLEKAVATHPSILAWRIPWTEGPGGLQSTGSQKSQTLQSDSHFHFHLDLPTGVKTGSVLFTDGPQPLGQCLAVLSKCFLNEWTSSYFLPLTFRGHKKRNILWDHGCWHCSFLLSAAQVWASRCPYYPMVSSVP